jgi:integrase
VFVALNGKRTSTKVGDKKEADKLKKRIEKQIKKGEFRLEETEDRLSDYDSILKNHVLPVFGNIPVTEITRGAIKDFIRRKINEGKATSTVKHFRSVISGVLDNALDDEVINFNPALGLKNIFPKKEKSKINPLTAEELQILLDAVIGYYPDHYPLFLLLARTGVRINEALAIKWDDIDFAGRFIEIRRSISRAKMSTTKTHEIRKVDISQQLADTLKQYRLASKKKGLQMGQGGLSEYLFTNNNDGLLDCNNWRRRIFKKALEKAGLRAIRIHDLRHTYATLRINAGHNINDVSGQLGHKSLTMTLDTYTHWLPGKQKSEIDELDNMAEKEAMKMVVN